MFKRAILFGSGLVPLLIECDQGRTTCA